MVFWRNTITNKDMFASCNLRPHSVVKRRGRRLPIVELYFLKDGRPSEGVKKMTWKRSVEKEASHSKQPRDGQKTGIDGLKPCVLLGSGVSVIDYHVCGINRWY